MNEGFARKNPLLAKPAKRADFWPETTAPNEGIGLRLAKIFAKK
jgi:hypothetical protein